MARTRAEKLQKVVTLSTAADEGLGRDQKRHRSNSALEDRPPAEFSIFNEACPLENFGF
jgi:hypothetical protein